jgi:hypothetical protein
MPGEGAHKPAWEAIFFLTRARSCKLPVLPAKFDAEILVK